MYYKVRHYQYKNRIGNLKSEAVGVVSGEKHFPIFPGNKATDEIQTIFHATVCLCRGVLVNDH